MQPSKADVLRKKADAAWDAAQTAHFKKDFSSEREHTRDALEHQRQIRELLK